ncbi:MAG TPA: glycosyltransferase family 4 protein [Chitinophagaceae bacterium]|nr:glycosyltransferase family 4 protein [Chitinophagaceae bacterium]
MKIVSTSYSKTTEFTDPEKWLERINFYTGILEELAKRHEVISIERINYEGELKQGGVHYFFIRQKKKITRFPRRMHRLIKQHKPGAVLVNGLIFPWQVIQLRLKLGRSVKIICIHRSEKPSTGIKKYLQRFAGRFVDAYLFTSSEFGKDWVKKGNIGSMQKIHEVMHGSSVFHPANRADARSLLHVTGSPVFLWVGRLNDNKDPLAVVKGFKKFLLHQPSASLYMIYHTEELLGEIKKLIADAENIKLIGKVEHSELQNWYNAADFMVSGSHYEGGGIAICEAMSCGCIPLITDIIAFRKMTGPGKCGLLYPAGNDDELLVALLKTKSMDIEKERIKVLQQFKEELSFEAIAGKIDRVISLLNKE